MITKEKLKSHIEHFPDEMTIDQLIDRLVFIEKVERGLEQSEQGETITEEELLTEIQTWFK